MDMRRERHFYNIDMRLKKMQEDQDPNASWYAEFSRDFKKFMLAQNEKIKQHDFQEPMARFFAIADREMQKNKI